MEGFHDRRKVTSREMRALQSCIILAVAMLIATVLSIAARRDIMRRMDVVIDSLAVARSDVREVADSLASSRRTSSGWVASIVAKIDSLSTAHRTQPARPHDDGRHGPR